MRDEAHFDPHWRLHPPATTAEVAAQRHTVEKLVRLGMEGRRDANLPPWTAADVAYVRRRLTDEAVETVRLRSAGIIAKERPGPPLFLMRAPRSEVLSGEEPEGRSSIGGGRERRSLF